MCDFPGLVFPRNLLRAFLHPFSTENIRFGFVMDDGRPWETQPDHFHITLVRMMAYIDSFLLFLSLVSTLISVCRGFTVVNSDVVISRIRTRTRHKPIHSTTTIQAKAGKSKEDIDDMLSSIGLDPVSSRNGKSQTTKKAKTNRPKKRQPEISLKTQLDYARMGHTVLRNFIPASTLQRIKKEVIHLTTQEELKAWRQKVQVALNSAELAASCQTVDECRLQLESLGIADVPFLQYFNTWTSLPEVKKLVFSLGEAASTMLDVPKVRLYQDSIFWKRSFDGPTPWHVDAKMAPFDTQHMITFWIPLTDIPASGTALMFCSKSHSDFALPYWNPVPDDEEEQDARSSEWDRLELRYQDRYVDYMPMKLGDVTLHSGWTLHYANGNDDDNEKDRLALAISYVDAKAELRPDALDDLGKGDNEDLNSYRKWATSILPRTQFEHELVPIVWPSQE